MGQPYIGEIRLVGFNFAPSGWNFCNGAVLSISEYSALFQLIGTTYGGDGVQTFALPNLQSRAPVHQGTGPSGTSYIMGQLAGEETVTLNSNQIPIHTHAAQAGAGPSINPVNSPANNFWAGSPIGQYSSQPPSAALNPAAVSSLGGGQPHENMPPFLVMNYIISLFGIFPSQS